MRFKTIVLFLFFGIVQGCYDSSLIFEDQYRVVLEAYIYQGKKVQNVKLSSMISFGNDSTGGAPISDALMVLESAAKSWALLENDSIPGLYYLLDDLEFNPGDTYKLTASSDENEISATTVIPEAPPVILLSVDSIGIKQAHDMMDIRDIEMPDPLELTWDNPELEYYFFRIQNIETSAELIRPEPPDDMPFARGGFAFQMDTRPVNDASYRIEMQGLTHYGTHRIIVYSVNDEYVQLYNSQDQDSRELNEPFSNVENGLGIFTAFSSDTLYFEVFPL